MVERSMLVFSSKFPGSLRRKASLLHTKADYSGNLEKASLIARLTADNRMDPVWNELTKRVRVDHKPTSEFSHPALPPPRAATVSAEDAQTKALEELLYSIVIAVECSRHLSTAPVVDVANLLLQEADRLQGHKSRRSERDAGRLSKAVETYSTECKADPAQEVALELATYLKKRFGNPMYETTATIVSVALEKEVTRPMVRNWYSASVLKRGQNDQCGAHC
jgi:hypothetical protein